MVFIAVASALVCSVSVLIVLGWWSVARSGFRYPDEEGAAAERPAQSTAAGPAAPYR